MKVAVTNRPDVADYFQFQPDFGFVQVGGRECVCREEWRWRVQCAYV